MVLEVVTIFLEKRMNTNNTLSTVLVLYQTVQFFVEDENNERKWKISENIMDLLFLSHHDT